MGTVGGAYLRQDECDDMMERPVYIKMKVMQIDPIRDEYGKETGCIVIASCSMQAALSWMQDLVDVPKVGETIEVRISYPDEEKKE